MILIAKTYKVWTMINHWRAVSRQRRELHNMSDFMLKDIGLSRTDADREASRPFWKNAPVSDPTLRRNMRAGESIRTQACRLNCCNQH